MIRRLFKLLWSMLVLAFLVYLVFFVQLGEHTLYQHLARISQTEEAQEMTQEVKKKGSELRDQIKKQIDESRPEAKHPKDAGAKAADAASP